MGWADDDAAAGYRRCAGVARIDYRPSVAGHRGSDVDGVAFGVARAARVGSGVAGSQRRVAAV